MPRGFFLWRWRAGFSSRWLPLWFRSTGSRALRLQWLQRASSRAQAQYVRARACRLRGMWGPPSSGTKAGSPASAGGFLLSYRGSSSPVLDVSFNLLTKWVPLTAGPVLIISQHFLSECCGQGLLPHFMDETSENQRSKGLLRVT